MCIEDVLNRLATRQGSMGDCPKRQRHQVCQIDETGEYQTRSQNRGSSCSGPARRRVRSAVWATARDGGIHGIPSMLMAYRAVCLSRDASCLEEPYPATGPIQHDAACNDAVLGSGQQAASAGICAAVAPACKQWVRAVAGPDHGSLTHRHRRPQIGSCVGRFKV
jgi:hypothetical protein